MKKPRTFHSGLFYLSKRNVERVSYGTFNPIDWLFESLPEVAVTVML
jgi:hypothetical protein